MRGRGGWGARCVVAMTALGLLTHCGGPTSEDPAEPPLRQHRPPGIQPPNDNPSPHLPPWPDSPPPTGGSGGGVSTAWVKQYGGKGVEKLHALATDAAGGFVAAGLFGDAPFPRGAGFALARYAADGTPLWSRQVTTDGIYVKALTVTPEGNILVVGKYGESPDLGTGPLPAVGTTDGGFFIAKFSPSGQTVWVHGFVASDYTNTRGQFRLGRVSPEAVTTDAQGSLIVVGQFFNWMSLGGSPLFAGPGSLAEDYLPGGFIAKFNWRGEHVWSRAIESRTDGDASWPRAVSTTPEGKILVGGRASAGANLGGGALPTSTPFIARYGGDGRLEWQRLFSVGSPLPGSVKAVRALSTGDVAFNANLGGLFDFNGRTYQGGSIAGATGDLERGFTGILRSTGVDGWLLDMNRAWLGELVATGQGGYAVTGIGYGLVLGGAPVVSPRGETATPFVASILPGGSVAWARGLDRHFTGQIRGDWQPRLQLAAQPGDRLLLGGDFYEPLLHEGSSYTSHGISDLFYLQLGP